jgi:AcrR family transcriptional regulator
MTTARSTTARSTRPRKQPRQQRAHETRARILEAAARVFAERGYAGGTTNHIAVAAGLSVGSLYQYFPNKDAIVVAVLDRFADDLAGRIGAQLEATMSEPWQAGGRALLDVQIELFEEHADLLRIIVEQIPRLGPVDKLDSLRRRMSYLVRLYLILNRERTGVRRSAGSPRPCPALGWSCPVSRSSCGPGRR